MSAGAECSGRKSVQSVPLLHTCATRNCPIYRVEVTGLEAGSVIINFELRGSANSADATVLQLRLALEEMIADTSSRLYTGIVTRDIDTEATLAAIAAGAWVFEEAQDIDSVDYDLIVSETSKKLQDDTIAGDVVDLSVRSGLAPRCVAAVR